MMGPPRPCMPGHPTPRRMAMLPLKVKGSQIVDPGGRAVRLRGFCVGGWMNMENFINGYPGQESSFRSAVGEVLGKGKAGFFFSRMLDYFLAEDDIRFMASLGANVLRVPFNYRHFEDDARPFHYRPEGLARLDRVVGLCRRHGIYVILDLHAAQGFQNTDWHCDNPTHKAFLWTQPQFQDRVAALWVHLARHYRNEPAVAGYNLINEPVCRERGALPALYRRLVSAVRKVDPGHILFLEGNWFSTDFSEIEPDLDSNTVFSSHNYAPPSFESGPYPGKAAGKHYDAGRLASDIRRVTSFMRKNGKGCWVGEFGSLFRGNRNDPGRLQVVRDQIAAFNRMGYHWTIWTYKDLGVMGTLTLEGDSPWMRRTAKVRALKNRLGTDLWGIKQSVSYKAVERLAGETRRALGGRNLDWKAFRWNASRMLAGLLLSESLERPFAEQFRGMTEKRIDEMMRSFAFDRCKVRRELAETLREGFRDGRPGLAVVPRGRIGK